MDPRDDEFIRRIIHLSQFEDLRDLLTSDSPSGLKLVNNGDVDDKLPALDPWLRKTSNGDGNDNGRQRLRQSQPDDNQKQSSNSNDSPPTATKIENSPTSSKPDGNGDQRLRNK